MNGHDGSTLTETGIPGVGRIPFGIHFCHFYTDRKDLADSLVPYFRAGLENDERCLWLTADPFPSTEAQGELASVLPSLPRLIQEGSIRILDADRWYAGLQTTDVIGRWLQEEGKALAEGYRGLRIAGNTSCVKRQDWDALMRYEDAFSKSIAGHQIVAICNYSLRQAKATDLFEVARHHQHTLCRDDRQWEVVDEAYGPMGRA